MSNIMMYATKFSTSRKFRICMLIQLRIRYVVVINIMVLGNFTNIQTFINENMSFIIAYVLGKHSVDCIAGCSY